MAKILKRTGIGESRLIDIQAYTMIAALVAIWVIFYLLTEGTYLTPRNLALLFRQMAVVSILTMGVLMLIIGGHLDLSVGSVMGFTGAIAAILHVNFGWDPLASIVVALATGIIIGVWQGFWVAIKKVPAFIVTLGGMMIFRGALLGITHGNTIAPLSKEFKVIGQGYLSPSISLTLAVICIIAVIFLLVNGRRQRIRYGFKVETPPAFLLKLILYCGLIFTFVLIMNQYEGVPIPVLVVLGLAILLTFITTKTQFGRYVYAMGGNQEAARLSGINTEKITFILFVVSGLFASIASIILTARLNAATTSAGLGAELDAVAAAVIGGTSLSGGIGSVPRAIVGALVMASLDNGMSLMNVEVFYQQMLKGLILILAVWLDTSTKQKSITS
ncbi:Xylose transport system permease protein XylH [Neomoorella glycerini]|uniref:Xylose transport system permease protein XylH n=1 Tax=Neomoorella glycerini TaxID=55779 RepID=A0A6I5ZLU6_9FIRM|nr:sugar ABC transporter permease [Moorella glycerini]QGP90842.1 Xylose transport system permease protein XylH [Moorella glycerini]